MSEFFVRKQHRRVGMGRDAATLIFDRFAGEWEIVEYQRNPGAVAFWRRVLAGYCPGGYTERSPPRRSPAALQEPPLGAALTVRDRWALPGERADRGNPPSGLGPGIQIQRQGHHFANGV